MIDLGHVSLFVPIPNTVTVLRLAEAGVPDLPSSDMAVPFVAHGQESCIQVTILVGI